MHRRQTTTTPAVALLQVCHQTTAPPDIPNVIGEDTTYAVKPEDGDDDDDDDKEDMSVDGDDDETRIFYTVGDDGKGTSTVNKPLPDALGGTEKITKKHFKGK